MKDWVLPAAEAAYEHRDKIRSAWNAIRTLLTRKHGSVGITGMSGVGKTVLLDFLTGAGFEQGYTPPEGKSEAPESGRLDRTAKKILLTTVPGQDFGPRYAAIEELFEGDNPVDGVVHVVAMGFAQVREEIARELFSEEGLTTTAQYCQYQVEQELRDLDETCEIIRASIRRSRKPSWMIVVATKIDLYHSNVDDARTYYSTDRKRKFVPLIQTLLSKVGADNFRWKALPVCSYLTDFEWNGETTPSTLGINERDHYLARFAKALEKSCGGE